MLCAFSRIFGRMMWVEPCESSLLPSTRALRGINWSFSQLAIYFIIIKKDAAEAAPKNSEVTASLASAQPKSDRAASAAPEDSTSADAAASDGTTPPAVEDAPAFSQQSVHPDQQKESPPAGADYHAPTVGETVVRMLHHMSKIFEDNSKADQIHRGLQIDRKRRQELRRKRLAMGHKLDDHEEQTFR